EELPAPPDPWGRNQERVGMRKAQYGFGWDWGPRLPAVGIWRPAELRRERRAAIAGVHFATVDLDRDQGGALVRVGVEADAFAATGPLAARVRLLDGERTVAETEVPFPAGAAGR